MGKPSTRSRLEGVALPALLLLLTSCGWVERERQEAAAAAAEVARIETLAELERLLSDVVSRADRTAGSADRILSPLPVMTPAEEAALRRFLGATHVARARELGVRVDDEEELEALLAQGRLIQLEDSTDHWIVREGTSPAYAVPSMSALLATLGARFQARLAEIGLPPYRIEVTSALRTSEGQNRLRRTNANAATDVSSHEFGATVDLSYAAFAPPAGLPDGLATGVPDALHPHVERIAALALESVSGRKSRELGKIFSEVLREAQDEGIALVIYERQQTVYHLTVARELSAAPRP